MVEQRIVVVKSGSNNGRCDILRVIDCDELPDAPQCPGVIKGSLVDLVDVTVERPHAVQCDL